MSTLRVFAFEPDWGLPTTGPYNDIPYEFVGENDSRKGPLGKSPWIELDGQRMGDSSAIIAHLAKLHGVAVTAPGRDAHEEAAAHAFNIAFEDRFHQILEWELFVHPAGFEFVRAQAGKVAPGLIGGFLAAWIRRHFRKQLHARGIGRLPPQTIAEKGRADLDALAAWLSDRSFLAGGTEPTLADFSVFGQVTPVMRWPMDTPVARYARTLKPLQSWCERITERTFARPAVAGSAGSSKAAPPRLFNAA
jgi:glutathione S-transferase